VVNLPTDWLMPGSKLKSTKRERRKRAILVLGMHRSGTSALTRVLNLCGADLPKNLMQPIGGNNETGFWESRDYYELHQRILKSVGSTWTDPAAMPEHWFGSPAYLGLVDEMVRLLEADFRDSRQFVIKDPRMCRFVPLWRDALARFGAEPAAVLTVRNPDEVAASLRTRDQLPAPLCYLLWLRHVLDAEKFSRSMPRCFVRFDELLEDWRGTVKRVSAALDLGWPAVPASMNKAVEQFLQPPLQHHRFDDDEFLERSNILRWVRTSYGDLQDVIAGGDDARVRRSLDRTRAALNEADRAYGPILSDQRQALWVSTNNAAKLQSTLEDRNTTLTKAQTDLQRTREELVTAKRSLTELREAARKTETQRLQEENAHSRERAALQARVIECQNAIVQRDSRLFEREKEFSERETAFQQRIAELSQQLSDEIAIRVEAQKQLDSAHNALIQSRTTSAERAAATEQERQRLARFRSELDRLTDAVIGNLGANEARLLHNIRARDDARAPLESQVRLVAAAVTHMRRAYDNLRQRMAREYDDLETRLAHTRKEMGNQSRELEALRSEHNSLANSVSWRFTKPLRIFAAFAARVWQLFQMPFDIARIKRSGLFDADWYLSKYTNVAVSGRDPLIHYLWRGARKGRDPNPLFDTSWYLQQYPEAVKSGLNPLLHFIRKGAAAGCNPNPLFHTAWYVKQHPEAVTDSINPLLHYLMHKGRHGCIPNPLFDPNWYLEQNPELAEAAVNPLAHYLHRGAREGRDPNPLFDTSWYLARYPEVADSGLNPLADYLLYGVGEGRDPNPLFDTSWYLEQYPDVAKSGMNPLLHFLRFGASEGRDPTRLFNTSWYLREYPDVAEGGVNPLIHYLYKGAHEGRRPGPGFDTRWYLNQYPDVAESGMNPLAHFLHKGAREGRHPTPSVTTEVAPAQAS
jgi:hypothetical protein